MTEKQKAELNILMAEKVLGWTRHQEKPYREGVDTSPFAMWKNADGVSVDLVSNWNPVEDYGQALLVLSACLNIQSVQIGRETHNRFFVIGGKGVCQSIGATLSSTICDYAAKLFAWKQERK